MSSFAEMTPQSVPRTRRGRWLAAATLCSVIALSGCATTGAETTAQQTPKEAAEAQIDEPALRKAAVESTKTQDYVAAAAYWGALYERNPDAREVAVGYSKALGQIGSLEQSLIVMQRSQLKHPDDAAIMAEYGKLQGSFAARLAQRKRASTARRRLDTLSNRERQVLGCMLDYGTSKEIARYLGISPRTVEAHRANLMVRLDVRTATQAIRVAVEGGACGAAQAFASPSGRGGEGGNSPAPARVLQ